MMLSSVSPGTYSMTMKKTPSCFSAVVIATMFGWLTDASSRGSRSSSPKSRFWRCGTLIATFLSIHVSSARYTLPNPPLPRGERIRYFPTVCPRKNIGADEYTLRVRPRFYVPSLTATTARVELPDDEAEHLVRVLRLGVGDEIDVIDGHGGLWRAEVVQVGKK